MLIWLKTLLFIASLSFWRTLLIIAIFSCADLSNVAYNLLSSSRSMGNDINKENSIIISILLLSKFSATLNFLLKPPASEYEVLPPKNSLLWADESLPLSKIELSSSVVVLFSNKAPPLCKLLKLEDNDTFFKVPDPASLKAGLAISLTVWNCIELTLPPDKGVTGL